MNASRGSFGTTALLFLFFFPFIMVMVVNRTAKAAANAAAKLAKSRSGHRLMVPQWFRSSFFDEKEPDWSPEAATSLGDARILWLVVV